MDKQMEAAKERQAEIDAQGPDITLQMESDTTTEERETLFQRADMALAEGTRKTLADVHAQLIEHAAMYEADAAMPTIRKYLHKLNVALESTGNPT